MAPLTEVSETDVRRNASTRRPLLPPTGLRSSPAKPKTSQENDAIQNMPNMDLDTGNGGKFSVCPSQMRKDNSQTSCQQSSSSGSVSTSSRPWGQQPSLQVVDGYKQHGPRSKASSHGLSQQGTVRSVRTSHHNGRRPRIRGQRSYGYGFETYANHPPVSYGFHTHRSLMTLRGQGDPTTLQPQASFPYVAHRQPSSIRVPSPAFSDTHVALYPPLPPYHRSVSAGPDTPSHPPQYRPPFYGPDINRSVSSLQRFPSPVISNGGYPTRRSPYPSRSVTPVPSAFAGPPLVPRQSWEGHYRMYKTSYASMAPAYYDYSESYHHRASPSVTTNASVASLPAHAGYNTQEDDFTPHARQARTPFGFMPGSIFNPSELSASPKPVPPSATDATRRRSSSQMSSSRSSNGYKAQHGAGVKTYEANGGSPADQNTKPPEQQRADSERCRNLTHKRSDASLDPFFVRDGRDMTDKIQSMPHTADWGPKASGGLQSQAPSSVQVISGDSSLQKISKSITLRWPNTKEMFDKKSRMSDLHGSSHTNKPLDDRPKSSDETSKADRMGIHCPTPERPISSQSSNIRFRKVLGLSDNDTLLPLSKPAVESSQKVIGNRLNNCKGPPTPVLGTSYQAEIQGAKDKSTPRGSREVTSCDTDREKSTVESLLDHHIESLGLGSGQPEPTEPVLPELRSSTKSTASLDRDLRPTRLSDRLGDIHWKGHVRSATERFESFTSMTSEQRALVPRRLFHGSTGRRSVGEQIEASAIKDGSERLRPYRERPSASWMTLPSTSAATSENQNSERGAKSESRTSDGLLAAGTTNTPEPKIKLSAAIRHSDSAPHVPAQMGCMPRQEMATLGAGQETPPQARLRLRVKVKDRSLSASQSKSTIAEKETRTVDATPPSPSAQISHPVSENNAASSHVQGRTQNSPQPPIDGSQEPVRFISSSQRRLQKRPGLLQDDSINPLKPTAKPHKRPQNQERPILGVQPDSKYPRLADPDFGPPLTPMSFDFSLQSSTDAAPRVQKSSFSADSLDQGVKDSLRKRLHGIGNRFNVSPKASTDRLLEREHSKKSGVHARKKRRHGRHQSGQQNGTIGMSDFAYKKRKWLERLKAWWERQKSRFRGEKSDEPVEPQPAGRARWSDSNTTKNMFTF